MNLSKFKLPLVPLVMLVINAFIFGLIYTHILPYIYNIVNSFTNRGEDLDDNIDYINSVITVLTWSIFIGIIFIIIGLLFGGFYGFATFLYKGKK